MSLVFVDTNIIAYARDGRETRKQAIAEAWLTALARTRSGRLSWQVLTEFYQVATHPKQLALSHELARADVRALHAWVLTSPDASLLETAWRLLDQHSYSWWDALIVAAALQNRCELLLTEDLQDGAIVDSALRILNPFAPDSPPPPA